MKLQHGSVDCRIGSLEMFTKVGEDWPIVDCRIGSLEITDRFISLIFYVDCRIGSLEREGGALMIYYCG